MVVLEGHGQPLLIGSVKTNIGHLEAAAGVTGLIKLVLSLQQRMIPPHLHFERPSPHIGWDEWPVRVPTSLTPWEPIDGRRIAGVSSFGFSGTNAHVVVEEAPAEPVTVAIARFSGPSAFEFPYASIMAAGALVTIPLIVMVLVFQRRIVSGLTSGSLK